MAEVALHPAARQEYKDAAAWYQRQSQGAARRFVEEVERTLARIGTQPDWYGWFDDEFREAILLRFPYSVVYRVEASGSVLIMAIAHASREPGYWQSRA